MIRYSQSDLEYSVGVTPVTGLGFSVGLWWWPGGTGDRALIDFSIPSSAVNADRYIVWWRDALGGIQAEMGNAGSSDAVLVTGIVSSTWNFIGAAFTSTSSRTVYINGSSNTSTNGQAAPVGITTCTLGAASASSSITRHTGGIISLPTVWNAALTSAEFKSLSLGTHPLSVRPNDIVAHWDTQSPGASRRTKMLAYSLTDVGSPTKLADPGFLVMKSPNQPKFRNRKNPITFRPAWALASQQSKILGLGVR